MNITGTFKSRSPFGLAEWFIANIDSPMWGISWAALWGMIFVTIVSVPLAASLNIWLDEGFTLHSTGSGPVYAYLQSINFEGQPPLYFVIESLWRMLNETSIFYARFLSIIFMAIAVAIIVFTAAKVAPRINLFVVALVTAFNPIVIWCAVELRVYPLVFLVGAILTLTFSEGFLASKSSRLARNWYVAFAIIGLYTQYYVGFVLLAHFIILLIFKRNILRAFIGLMTIVSIAFVPFIGIVRMHMQMADTSGMVINNTFFQTAHQFIDVMFMFMLPHNENWTGVWKIAGFGISTLLIIALFTLGRPKLNLKVDFVLSQWLACLATFIVLFSVLGVPQYLMRHIMVLAPSSILVTFIVLSSITRLRSFLYRFAILVFIVLASSQFWNEYHSPLSKYGDWKRVATTLMQEKSTPVAVFTSDLEVPLKVYLPSKVISIPNPTRFTLDYYAAVKLNSEQDVANALDSVYLTDKSKRVWMVTEKECHEPNTDGNNVNCQFLENYLNERYHRIETVQFNGSLVRLFERIEPKVPSISRGTFSMLVNKNQ